MHTPPGGKSNEQRDTISVEATLPCRAEGPRHHLDMPIHGPPKPSTSGGNENSSGGPLPLSLLAPATEGVATHSIPKPITAECCTCLPVCHSCPRPQLGPGSSPCVASLQSQMHKRPPVKGVCFAGALLPGAWGMGEGGHNCGLHPSPHSMPQGQGSFGCVWCIYHLAHGRLTRIQRLFGAETCSTPVLNRTQQGYALHFTQWSIRYYNQDLLQKTLQPGAALTGAAVSHVHSTCQCSAC